MADIDTSTFSETAASNNTASPDGAPEGMAASGVNDTIREVMGAIKREWNRTHATFLSTGGTNSYSISYATSPSAYVQGLPVSFNAHLANTGAVQVYVNALGAKTLKKPTSSGLADLDAGDIQPNAHVHAEYNVSAGVLVAFGGLVGAGGATQAGSFGVSGTLSAGFAQITGASTFASTVGISATASVGFLTVGGTAAVTGAGTFASTVGVSATASVGHLLVNGNAVMAGSLGVSATASVGALIVAGQSIAGGSAEYLLTATAGSGAASLIIDSIPATAINLRIDYDIAPATNNVNIALTFREGAGTDITARQWDGIDITGGTVTGSTAQNSDPKLNGGTTLVANTANSGRVSGSLRIFNIQSALYKGFTWQSTLNSAPSIYVGAGQTADTGTITGIKIAASSGNITGRMSVYYSTS